MPIKTEVIYTNVILANAVKVNPVVQGEVREFAELHPRYLPTMFRNVIKKIEPDPEPEPEPDQQKQPEQAQEWMPPPEGLEEKPQPTILKKITVPLPPLPPRRMNTEQRSQALRQAGMINRAPTPSRRQPLTPRLDRIVASAAARNGLRRMTIMPAAPTMKPRYTFRLAIPGAEQSPKPTRGIQANPAYGVSPSRPAARTAQAGASRAVASRPSAAAAGGPR